MATTRLDDTSCTFDMPAGNVVVSAEFTAVPNNNTIQGLDIELDGENIIFAS